MNPTRMVLSFIHLILGLAAALRLIGAQAPEVHPAFEVAAIKRSKPSTEGTNIRSDPNGTLRVQPGKDQWKSW